MTDKKNELENAKNQIEPREDVVKSSESKVAELSKVQNDSQQKVDNQQKVVDNAQKNVDQAQKAVDGSGIAEAQKTVDAAQENATRSQSELLKSQQDLATAKDEQTLAGSAVIKANNELATAKANAENAKVQVSNAKTEYDQANNIVKSAESLVSAITQGIERLQNLKVPTISFTEEQKNATQDLVNALKNKTIEIDKLPPSWANIMTGKQYITKWKDTSEADKNTIIDPNNLTLQQATELSNFASTILNQIRRDLGISDQVSKTEVSTGAVNMALDIAKQTFEDKWHYYGHDAYAVNTVAKKYGLPVPKNTILGTTRA